MVQKLEDIPGVGDTSADRIRNAGVDDVEDFSRADPEELAEKVDGVSADRMSEWVEEAARSAVVIQSGEEVVQEYEDLPKVPTGIDALDETLMGGWESGFLVAIGGETGAGKTQIAFQSLGQAVEDTGDPAVYIETERGRYRGNRVRQLFDEDVQSQVYKVGAYDLEQQRLAYDKVREQFDDVSCVVVDSFTARFRLGEQFSGRETLTERSTEFGKHLTALEKMASTLGCPVLLTCQVYGNPSQYGSKYTLYGGSLMMHTVNFVVMMKSKSGQLAELEIRNHPEVGDSVIELQITEDGVSEAME